MRALKLEMAAACLQQFIAQPTRISSKLEPLQKLLSMLSEHNTLLLLSLVPMVA